jgi:hypothetical protein
MTLYSVKEVAKMLGLTAGTVGTYACNGTIKSRKRNGRVYFTQAAIDKYKRDRRGYRKPKAKKVAVKATPVKAEPKKITLKEVRDSGMKVWKWLMENPNVDIDDAQRKEASPYYSEVKDYDSNCAACEYKEKVGDGDCSNCPLVGISSCGSGSWYENWCIAEDNIDCAYWAKKIYEAHEAIEVPEEKIEIRVNDIVHGDVQSHRWKVLGISRTSKCAIQSTQDEGVTIRHLSDLTFVSRPVEKNAVNASRQNGSIK